MSWLRFIMVGFEIKGCLWLFKQGFGPLLLQVITVLFTTGSVIVWFICWICTFWNENGLESQIIVEVLNVNVCSISFETWLNKTVRKWKKYFLNHRIILRNNNWIYISLDKVISRRVRLQKLKKANKTSKANWIKARWHG